VLNRRYQELLNQLPAALPAERDEIIQEMEGLERRLAELTTARGGRERGGTANDARRRGSAPKKGRPV
jgi:hypothetical protein